MPDELGKQPDINAAPVDQPVNSLLREKQRQVADLQAENESLRQQLRMVIEQQAGWPAQLKAVHAELESFVHTLAHDVRTPLRGIDGFSLALVEEEGAHLSENSLHYLERIRAAAEHMEVVIDSMLELSRVARAPMTWKEIDLSQWVRRLAEVLIRSEPQRQVEWNVEPGCTVTGDEKLLQIAVHNLVQNAWKFSAARRPAMIGFGCIEQGGRKVYFVKDNGAGFDMAFAGKLFGEFQRLHSVEEFGGAGIGLAMTHRIILRHGGQIWAEGAVDQGATFYFTLGQENIDHTQEKSNDGKTAASHQQFNNAH